MLNLIRKSYKKIFDKVPDPPYSYDFIMNLSEEDYPVYLKKLYKMKTGKSLNLEHPVTFNEKIQWLKLYDNSSLKSLLTDKVLARYWVKEKIGEEYIKPALWIGKNFDKIPFEELPNAFVIKANHGCKWQYIIKNKQKFLETSYLYKYVRMKFKGWMTQTFFPYGGFETQYKKIEPQILIEPLLVHLSDNKPIEYEIYCFNSKPKIYQKVEYTTPPVVSAYNEDFSSSNILFNKSYFNFQSDVNENLRKAVALSKELCRGFKLVRVDWLEFENKIYFNEMTFTPFSGFFEFEDEKTDKKLGQMLCL